MLLHRMLDLFMLLSVLPDLFSACPLTLHPPELVQPHGEPFAVNCTSTVDGHKGIYWTYGNETKHEALATFNLLSVAHVDWDTQARCTIKLSDTHECSKDLQITVYKRPDNITVRSNGTTLEGSVIGLQCDIDDVAPVQNLTVTWYKNNKTVMSENLTALTTMTVSSSLTWPMSREDDGALFTCEALLDLGPHGPRPPVVSNASWSMSVHYAPEFQDEHENHIYLNNSGGGSVHCDAMGNPPPNYTWTKDGVTVAKNTSYLNVNESTTYVCIASNYLGNTSKKFYVIETTAAPDGTETPEAPRASGCPLTITPDEVVVQYGGSSSANCSTSVTDAVGIGWEASTGGTSLINVTELTWKVETVTDWTILAECYITQASGSQCIKPLNITVYKPPDQVQVSLDGNDAMVEGTQHQLKCDIWNVAPVGKLQVKWHRDEELVTTQTARDLDVTPKGVRSTLTVTPEKEHNGTNFTCEAELLLGPARQNPVVKSPPYTAVVQYNPSILTCPNDYAGEEGDFKLSSVPCKADGNPEPVVHWYLQDTLINASKPLTRRDSGNYMARFENIIGNSSAYINITIEYGPSFSCKDHYDIKENGHLGSECEPEGLPKPSSVWSKDGIQMTSPQQWKRHDSGKYLIVATNKHGKANHTLSVNVLYAPRFSVGNSIKEISLGENVTLDCTAEGNPLPEVQWKYPPAANVKNNTRGRQFFVNVTGATSFNAAVYSCGATNKVGSVTRTVTLIMKEKTTRNNTWLWLLIVILILLIFIGALLYRNHKKKIGHYEVVDSVPLTTISNAIVYAGFNANAV